MQPVNGSPTPEAGSSLEPLSSRPHWSRLVGAFLVNNSCFQSLQPCNHRPKGEGVGEHLSFTPTYTDPDAKFCGLSKHFWNKKEFGCSHIFQTSLQAPESGSRNSEKKVFTPIFFHGVTLRCGGKPF
jgi:hypothetical protein